MTPDQELKMAERALAIGDTIASALAATQGTPLQLIMVRARYDAAQALIAMIDVDPLDSASVRKLQNEVQRFRDIVTYIRDAVSASDEAGFKLSQSEREDLADLVLSEGIETE